MSKLPGVGIAVAPFFLFVMLSFLSFGPTDANLTDKCARAQLHTARAPRPGVVDHGACECLCWYVRRCAWRGSAVLAQRGAA